MKKPTLALTPDQRQLAKFIAKDIKLTAAAQNPPAVLVVKLDGTVSQAALARY